jgi:DNA-binding transcriptional LysR family regulator
MAIIAADRSVARMRPAWGASAIAVEPVPQPISRTCAPGAAAYMLPPVLADLRATHPGIDVEIVVSNALSDLRRREADIAIRSVRPTDPDLIARAIAQGRAHLYAAHAYLDARGDPETPEALAQLDFVGFADNDLLLRGLQAYGAPVAANRFRLRSANHLVQWRMVCAGFGVGVMTESVGDAEPAVRRAAPWVAPFAYDVWLIAHRELRTSRRIRIVFDRLADRLRAEVARPPG